MPSANRFLPLLVLAVGTLGPVVAGSAQSGKAKKTQPGRAPGGKAKDAFLLSAPPKESLRFTGEVATDQQVSFNEDSFPNQEGITRLHWELPAESVPEAKRLLRETVIGPALQELGFTAIPDSELKALPTRYRGFGDMRLVNPDGVWFRAKDTETLQKSFEGIEVIGNREHGRLSALPMQVLVEVRPESFRFHGGEAECMLRLSSRLCGMATYQDSGAVGLFDPNQVRSVAFLKQVRAALAARRPKVPSPEEIPTAVVPPGAQDPESADAKSQERRPPSPPAPTMDEVAARMKGLTLRFQANAQMEMATVTPLCLAGRRDKESRQITVDLSGQEASIPLVTSFIPTFEFLADQVIYLRQQEPVVLYLGADAKSVSFPIYVTERPKYGVDMVNAKAVNDELEKVKIFRFTWPKAPKGYYAIYVPKTWKGVLPDERDTLRNVFVFKL